MKSNKRTEAGRSEQKDHRGSVSRNKEPRSGLGSSDEQANTKQTHERKGNRSGSRKKGSRVDYEDTDEDESEGNLYEF